MNNYKFENIVIGTGISSLGAIISLVRKKKKILIIESPKSIISKKNETIFCSQNLPIIGINNWKKLDINKVLSIKGYGGHSNIWGGSCLRLAENEFDIWPIKYKELCYYYGKCEKFLGIHKLSDQYEKKFDDDDIFYTKAKIAKSFKDKKNTFNTIEIIDGLIKNKKVSILKGTVKNIGKIENKQYLKIIDKSEKIFFENLFIGAGPFNTSKIIESSIKHKKLLATKQSQSFFVPALMFKKIKNLQSNSSYQIVIKKFFNNKRNLHIELKYSPHHTLKTIKKKLGFISFFIPKFITSRIIILSGFIPSNDSINFTNNKISKNKKIKLRKMKMKLNKIFKKLNEKFAFKIFKELIKFTQFGRSFHVGANIPMSNDNIKSYLTTNQNGKLNNKKFDNVYIIDSSIFPNIPSGVLGLTSMANAYRIVDKKFYEISNK